jgi:CRP-like cAMP-binding protein
VREKQFQSQHTPSTPRDKTEGKADFLAHSDIFRHLNTEEIKELDRVTTMITCQPGHILYRPGETGNTLFLLKTGRVQLYHLSMDGRKLIIATLERGACFGEIPLLGQGTHTSFAEVVEEARICVISKHEAEHLIRQKPVVTLALLHVVGQRFTQLEAQLINTTFKATTARLATLLLQLASPFEKEPDMFVVDGLSQEELAVHLGVYRETVSVSLRDLKDTGAIELGRKHITIIKPSLLEEIAKQT